MLIKKQITYCKFFKIQPLTHIVGGFFKIFKVKCQIPIQFEIPRRQGSSITP